MLKLMKYEFRKTTFLKLILLLVTVVSEAVFLTGVFSNKRNLLAAGIFSIFMCISIGIFCLGVASIIALYRDLNTKQSYMLFLTPHSSYEILGAKVLENGISLIIAGVLFTILVAVDVNVATHHIGGLTDVMNLVSSVLALNWSLVFTPTQIIFFFFGFLSSWCVYILNADLAVILSSSVLAGKRGNAVVSLIIFIALSSLFGVIYSHLPSMDSSQLTFILRVLASFVTAAILYFISGWIMENKLSV
jgi:ABC-2 type transport system permease protein